MTALAADRMTQSRDGKVLSLPVAASAVIYAGAIVCLNSSGFAVPASTSTTLKRMGVATEAVSGNGTNGGVMVRVQRGGWYRFANSASGDAIVLADAGNTCYLVDDQTVAKTDGSSSRSAAGTVRDVDSGGVWVEF